MPDLNLLFQLPPDSLQPGDNLFTLYGRAASKTGAASKMLFYEEQPPPEGAPATPENLQVTGDPPLITWDASATADSYVLRRDGTVIYDGPDLEYVDTDVTSGATHSYTVSAYNEAGSSAQSTVVQVTLKPATPAGLQATSGDAQVSLTWNASSGATGYTLRRNGAVIYTGGNLTYLDTGLTNGQTYSYTVSASNAAGESAESAAVSGTPVASYLYSEDWESHAIASGIPSGYTQIHHTGSTPASWSIINSTPLGSKALRAAGSTSTETFLRADDLAARKNLKAKCRIVLQSGSNCQPSLFLRYVNSGNYAQVRIHGATLYIADVVAGNQQLSQTPHSAAFNTPFWLEITANDLSIEAVVKAANGTVRATLTRTMREQPSGVMGFCYIGTSAAMQWDDLTVEAL